MALELLLSSCNSTVLSCLVCLIHFTKPQMTWEERTSAEELLPVDPWRYRRETFVTDCFMQGICMTVSYTMLRGPSIRQGALGWVYRPGLCRQANSTFSGDSQKADFLYDFQFPSCLSFALTSSIMKCDLKVQGKVKSPSLSFFWSWYTQQKQKNRL